MPPRSPRRSISTNFATRPEIATSKAELEELIEIAVLLADRCTPRL